uniref:Uncharacterized protein n=1 Tax=Mucochytrium quahogii TaxID=96639 RepID=A0A7S2S6Y8_9STRA
MSQPDIQVAIGEFAAAVRPGHHHTKSSILSNTLYETLPENYSYEMETSSKVSNFVPTILSEQQELQEKKRKGLSSHAISADDAMVDPHQDFYLKRVQSGFLKTAQRSFNESDMKSDRTTSLDSLEEEDGELHTVESNEMLDMWLEENNFTKLNKSGDNFEGISARLKDLSLASPPTSPSMSDDDLEITNAARGMVKNGVDEENRPKSTSTITMEEERKRIDDKTKPRVSIVEVPIDGSDHTSPPTTPPQIGSPKPILSAPQSRMRRFRTSSTICSVESDISEGSVVATEAVHEDVDEVPTRLEEKTAASNVVGKVLLGYSMTPSDEQLVTHWLAKKPEELAAGNTFKGLRQFLRMMRRFVNKKDEEGEENENAKGLENLQRSLQHISGILEKFTGIPLHSPGFFKLLQSDIDIGVVLSKLDGEFKEALREVRECTCTPLQKIDSQGSSSNEESPPEKPEVLTARVLGEKEKLTERRASGGNTSTKLTGDARAPIRRQRAHRRRRSATIDLLLLLAKLGLRREQTLTISDTAYGQFSRLLEGGAAETAALENLDQASAIELLGYLESFPKTLKEDNRIKRLGEVCKARLVLMIEESTVSDICDKLISQKHVTGGVREVATYAFHFSAALIGTHLTILRNARKSIVSTKLSAVFRGMKARQELTARKGAAERIQQWQKKMREEQDVVPQNLLGPGLDPSNRGGDGARKKEMGLLPPRKTRFSFQAKARKTSRAGSIRSWQSSENSAETRLDTFLGTSKHQRSVNFAVGDVTNRPGRSVSSEKASDTLDCPNKPTYGKVQLAPSSRDDSMGRWKLEATGQSASDRAIKLRPRSVKLDTLRRGIIDATKADDTSVGDNSSGTRSVSSGFYFTGEVSPRSTSRTINPVHALQGLVRHLARVAVSNAENSKYTNSEKLLQLQQHARKLRTVHPKVCVPDSEERPGLGDLPKASKTLADCLKNHKKNYGGNQTPYVFDFELGVLAFFPPCELDCALQPPNDTSAEFRKILSTVFELMPVDEEALYDLTETATLSQHASAGYAITTILHYIDKSTRTTEYMHTHHLGDEREGVAGTVAGGYVRYDEETSRYIFTEESGHYGFRWTFPGTRNKFNKFMKESNLEDAYYLKPFFRKKTIANHVSISEMFQQDVPVSAPRPMATSQEETPAAAVADDDSDWDFDD